MCDRHWSKIETAPKDGTRVIVYDPEHGVRFAEWDAEARLDFGPHDDPHDLDASLPGYAAEWDESAPIDGTGCCYRTWLHPTHWMPLPEAPGTPDARIWDGVRAAILRRLHEVDQAALAKYPSGLPRLADELTTIALGDRPDWDQVAAAAAALGVK